MFNPINFAVYHYAGNNPIKYTDPTGLASLVDDNGASRPVTNPNGKVILIQPQNTKKDGNIGSPKVSATYGTAKAEVSADIKNGNAYAEIGSETMKASAPDLKIMGSNKSDYSFGLMGASSGPTIDAWGGMKDDNIGARFESSMATSKMGLFVKTENYKIEFSVKATIMSVGLGASGGAGSFNLFAAAGIGLGVNIKVTKER